MDPINTPPNQDNTTPSGQFPDDNSIQETVVDLNHTDNQSPENEAPLEVEVAEPIDIQVPLGHDNSAQQPAQPNYDPPVQEDTYQQSDSYEQPTPQEQSIPEPNQIANSVAELLMSDVGPSQPGQPQQQMNMPPPPPQGPPQQAPVPQQPSFEANPIENPYVPSNIPTQQQAPIQTQMQQAAPATISNNLNPVQPRKTGINKKILAIIIAAVLIPLILGIIAMLVLGGENEQPDPSEQAAISAADSQRKTDAGVLLVAIKSYASDNEGKLLTIAVQEVDSFAQNYLPEDFNDPTTQEPYQLITEVPTTGEYQYITAAQCGEGGSIELFENPRTFAIRTLLENGDFYCVDA